MHSLVKFFHNDEKNSQILSKSDENHFPFRDAQGHPPLDRKKKQNLLIQKLFGIESTKIIK